MQTYVYYIAEKMPGAMEMQRFAHPIHVGLVTARDHEAAYTAVLEDLRPTFSSEPQLLEVRFEVVTPSALSLPAWISGRAGGMLLAYSTICPPISSVIASVAPL